MAKSISDAVLDSLIEYVADNCTRITVCSTQPTNYTEANSTYALADVTVTAGIGNGDFTKGDGDVSGRKLIVAEQAAIEVDTTGTAQHVALLNVSGTALLAVTTCTSQGLTDGNTVTIPTFDLEVSDPS